MIAKRRGTVLSVAGVLVLAGCGAVDGQAVSDGGGPITTMTSTATSTYDTSAPSTSRSVAPPFTGDPATVRCSQYMRFSESDQERIIRTLRPGVADSQVDILVTMATLFCVGSSGFNRDPLVSDSFDPNKYPN